MELSLFSCTYILLTSKNFGKNVKKDTYTYTQPLFNNPEGMDL